jgi:hypothetical protein
MSDEVRTGDPILPQPKHARREEASADSATEDGNIQDDGAASFGDTAVTSDEARKFDDRDLSASETPPFGDDADLPPRDEHAKERSRELKGNRGPDEIKGFGQGA